MYCIVHVSNKYLVNKTGIQYMGTIYLFNVLYKGSSRFNSMWSKLLTDNSKQIKHFKTFFSWNLQSINDLCVVQFYMKINFHSSKGEMTCVVRGVEWLERRFKFDYYVINCRWVCPRIKSKICSNIKVSWDNLHKDCCFLDKH